MRSSFGLAALLLGGLVGGCVTDESQPPPVDNEDGGSMGKRCPSHLKFTFLAGSRTDVGWTGLSHGSTFPRNAFFRVKVDKDTCEDDCSRCGFTGPVRDATVNTQRCMMDTRAECATSEDCPYWACREKEPGNPSEKFCINNTSLACVTDVDCGRSDCQYFVGPTFPTRVPQTCLAIFLSGTEAEPAVQGSIDFRTGDVQLDRFNPVTAAALPALGQPLDDMMLDQGACPVCVSDRVPNDGKREGTCQLSDVDAQRYVRYPYAPAEPQSCDAHGEGTLADFDGSYSLDCSMPVQGSVALGFQNASSFGDRRALSAAQPVCGENGERCWCGFCAGTYMGCGDDRDCSVGKACITFEEDPATPNFPLQVRANTCENGICNWDSQTAKGTCPSADVPGLEVGCFPSLDQDLVAPGKAERLSSTVYRVDIGKISCRESIRQTEVSLASAIADANVGLPGPQLNILKFEIDLEFEDTP